ncbi:MAG: hypothetical protein L0322_31995 [Chloroflexi bacterium]|nr:hypothetical protein [Chloroflexota bacterium]MCI0577917.1 hypothetical protein [Chloroflexota bacterium]MCI0645797.1 hypothetical protein [Chloroflexota bacterium]
MGFQPQVNQELEIDGRRHRVMEHPMAPGLPYGQEGRMATVYKLGAAGQFHALKVFKAIYRKPDIAKLSKQLFPFASLPGLGVCRRTVLDPQQYRKLVAEEADLAYAIVMPWVEGLTWMDVLTGDDELTPDQCRTLGERFARVLVGLEGAGIAHCDLSGANLLIDQVMDNPAFYLVDVEQLFGPGLSQPSLFLVGTPGYSHQRDPRALWGPQADRFSGAIMLGEMLGWCDPAVRQHAWGETYFDPEEMHQGAERFEILYAALQRHWGREVAGLFTEAWQSNNLTECAPFADWLSALPPGRPVPVQTQTAAAATGETTRIERPSDVATLMGQATTLEAQGDFEGAIRLYEQAQTVAGGDKALQQTIMTRINDLSLKQITRSRPATEQPAVTQTRPATGAPAVAEMDSAPTVVQQTQTRPGSPPVPPIVQQYTPAQDEVKKFGGLTRRQFTIVLVAFPILAAAAMFAIAQLLRSLDLWYTVSNTVSLPALLGPAIYAALRRKWLPIAVFVPIAFVGGLVVQTIAPGPLLVLVLLGGIVLEVMTQIGARLVRNPLKNWLPDLAWLALTGLLCGLVIYESLSPGLQLVNNPIFLVTNLVLGAVGWGIGRYLFQVVIFLRERTG